MTRQLLSSRGILPEASASTGGRFSCSCLLSIVINRFSPKPKGIEMAKKHTAQCACGDIKFEFNTDPGFVAICHCLDCKKASGGEAATFFGVPEDDFTLLSGKPKSFHYTAQSGKGLDRNFCPNCGARVFTSNLESFPGTVFVTLGSLDHPEEIVPKMEMFTKRRLKWAEALDMPQFENMPS